MEDTLKDSALDSMIGFKTQEYYALEQILAMRSTGGEVSLEDIEDVCFVKANHKVLFQIKHHVDNKNHLSNASTDIWKTIYNWIKKKKSNIVGNDDSYYLVVYQKKPLDEESYVDEMNKCDSVEEANILYDKLLVWYSLNYKEKEKKLTKYLDSIFDPVNKEYLLEIMQKFQLNLIRKEKTIDEIVHDYIVGSIGSDFHEHLTSRILKIFDSEIHSQYISLHKVSIDVNQFHEKLDKFVDQFRAASKFSRKTTAEEVKDKVENEKSNELKLVRELKCLELADEDIYIQKNNYYRVKTDIKKFIDNDLLLIDEYKEYCQDQFDGWHNLKIRYRDDTIETKRNIYFDCERYGEILVNEHVAIYFRYGNFHNILEDGMYPEFHWCEVREEDDNE